MNEVCTADDELGRACCDNSPDSCCLACADGGSMCCIHDPKCSDHLKPSAPEAGGKE